MLFLHTFNCLSERKRKQKNKKYLIVCPPVLLAGFTMHNQIDIDVQKVKQKIVHNVENVFLY